MSEPKQPENAVIIKAGEGRQDAVDLGHGIFMSRDISNLYRVLTDDGDVLINTGFVFSAEENVRRMAAVSARPIAKIVFTQSHEDHIGGWPHFTGAGVETIAQANFDHVRGYFKDSGLGPTMARRSRALWSRDQTREMPMERIEPTITTTFHDTHGFELGGRRFELYAVKGETLDSLVVWLPQDRIVFTGNLTGPLFGHIPNLYTVRGDKIRSARDFIASVQRVIDLAPEMLVTGHGEPIRGKETIRLALGKIRDAAQYILDRTFEGMNAGTDLWTLMGQVKLPAELAIPQGHGKIPWLVRAIWEEHLGWFRFESTTELYDVPVQAVMPDLVALAGGEAPVLELAQNHIEAGRPLHALHLAEAVLAAGPSTEAKRVMLVASEALLAREGRENFSEVRWLEAQIARLSREVDSAA